MMLTAAIEQSMLHGLVRAGMVFAFCLGAVANASDHELILRADARAVFVDSPLESFTEGGLGLLRFDAANDGLQLGRAMIDLAGPLSETLRYTVTTSATDDGDQNVFDLTEAFIDWRPYPHRAWRWRTRIGAFYAPISLENRAAGWESLYSISPSAINTWIGEEARTIGGEIAATRLGAHSNQAFDVTLLASAYQWNDPLGVLIFERGWGIHDRQTPLFGDLPRLFVTDERNRTLELFDEIDDRIGYYLGAEVRTRSDSIVRVLHYDNLGNADDASAKEPAWRTRFDSFGIRVELPLATTLLLQGMSGDTEAGPQGTGQGLFVVDFWSYYVLVSTRQHSHRFTARFDRLYTDTQRGATVFYSAQNAHAWTLAYQYDFDEHWQIALEGVRIEGSLAQRALHGLEPHATERQLQVAIRWML